MNKDKEKLDIYLDEIAEEYKNMLLAILINDCGKTYENLSITDLVRIDDIAKRSLISYYKNRNKKTRTLTFLSLYLIITSVVLSSLILFINKEHNYSLEYALGITAVFTGITGLIALYLQHRRRMIKLELNNSDEILNYKLVQRWRQIESIVQDLSIKNKKTNSGSAIMFLLQYNMINESDRIILSRLLKIRNSLLYEHGDKQKIDSSTKKELLNDTENILRKLMRKSVVY